MQQHTAASGRLSATILTVFSLLWAVFTYFFPQPDNIKLRSSDSFNLRYTTLGISDIKGRPTAIGTDLLKPFNATDSQYIMSGMLVYNAGWQIDEEVRIAIEFSRSIVSSEVIVSGQKRVFISPCEGNENWIEKRFCVTVRPFQQNGAITVLFVFERDQENPSIVQDAWQDDFLIGNEVNYSVDFVETLHPPIAGVRTVVAYVIASMLFIYGIASFASIRTFVRRVVEFAGRLRVAIGSAWRQKERGTGDGG